MNKLTLMVAATALVLSGCASDAKKTSSSADKSAAGSSSSSTGISTSGAGSDAGMSTRPVEAAPAPAMIDISRKVVYFAFDSSAIRSADLETVSAHAKHLATNPGVKVRLEGHADERGTREYNVALGERRANSVRDALLLRGASARQISVVSYGEERPVVGGHSDAAWSKNRRVEFVY